jgi:hypothetical protein
MMIALEEPKWVAANLKPSVRRWATTLALTPALAVRLGVAVFFGGR